MLRWLVLILALLAPAPALAQAAVLQGGPWTQAHAPMYVGNGSFGNAVIQDSGPAGGGGIGLGMSEGLYVATGTGAAPFSGQGTGPLGTNWCNYDAPITNTTGFHYLCLSPNIAGNLGAIVYGNNGLATAQPLAFNVDGVQQIQLSAAGTNFTAPILFGGNLPVGPGAQTLCENPAGVLSFNCASGSGGGNPGGANLSVQYNAAGSFAGVPPVANGFLITDGSSSPTLGTQGNLTLAVSLASATMPIFISTGAVQQATIGTLAAGNAISITGTTTVTIAADYTAGTGIAITGPSIALNGTLSGNGSVFATSTGTLMNGHCVSIDASGNFIDAGGACTTGGGGGTVSSALINQLAYYASAGTVVSGLATANSAVLCTSAGGVPSLCTTLPGGLTFSGTTTITTLALTNPNTPANGGSGIASPTAHSILQAEGASVYNLITAVTAGRIIVDQGAGADWLPKALSGDCALASSGAITCTKTSGVAFGTFATANAATPPAIGGTTPAAGAFTTLSATGNLTTNITGSLQCVQASSIGVISGAGGPCGSPAAAGGRLVAVANPAACAAAPPIQTANISGGTAIAYVPFLSGLGNVLTIAGNNYNFTTLCLTLNSGHQLAGNAYDVYAKNGTTICTDALPWTGTPPTTPGHAPSQQANGLYTNATTIADCWNGVTDNGPINSGTGLWLGTMIASANGQTAWLLTPAFVVGGTNNILGIFNAYNQLPVMAHEWDGVVNYLETGNTTGLFNRFNASAANAVTWIDGLGFNQVEIRSAVTWAPNTNAQTVSGGAIEGCPDYDGSHTCGPGGAGVNAIAGCFGIENQDAFGTWSNFGVDASNTMHVTTVCSLKGMHSVTLLLSIPNGANGGAPVLVGGKSASGMFFRGLM